jgi:hypothetical protein
MADTLADYETELNYNHGFFKVKPLKFLGVKFTKFLNLITDALGKTLSRLSLAKNVQLSQMFVN